MIKKYKEHFERAESARIELEKMITDKTGHACVASTRNHSHKNETEYTIMCFSPCGLKAVSELFTDKPFFQEEFGNTGFGNGLVYRISCNVPNVGAPLEIFAHLNKAGYKEWVRNIHAMGVAHNE